MFAGIKTYILVIAIAFIALSQADAYKRFVLVLIF